MRTTVAAVCLLLLSPLTAHAGPIVVDDFRGVFVGYFSPVTSGESRARLGSVLMSDGDGISPSIDGRTFEAYCVDILGAIFDPGTPQPPATFDAIAAPMSTWDMYSGALPAAGRYASWLYKEYAAGIAAANDNVGRTALQMAIWNVLYDTDFTVDTGGFRVSASDTAVRLESNKLLAALAADLGGALLADATWLQLRDCSVSPCRDVQDFMGPRAAVPEPSSLALLGLGAAATFVRRRRRA